MSAVNNLSIKTPSLFSVFLTSGMTKGSLKLRLAAIVSTGSKQQNKAPNRIIFPICGSTGNLAKWTPRGVNSSCLSKAL